MRVLVGCERSGVVRRAFRERGHDAWSCDLEPADDGSPFHIQADVLTVLDQGWDLGIFHPPCTYLTNAGVRHLHSVPSRNGVLPKIHGPARWNEMRKGAVLFNALKSAPIPRIALENPIPHKYARELIGGYTQLIQPWMFGHGETKATCLWLKGLPPLERTHRPGDFFCKPEPIEREQCLHKLPPSPDRAKLRSITFEGIARAFAEQWGCLILFLLCWTATAQPVIDLGVMTPNRMIYLERDTNRSDFSHYVIQAQNLFWPSNSVTLIKTNDTLTIDDFLPLGPGAVAIGVYSVCLDGQVSPMSVFRVDVRRNSPSAPKARSVAMLKPNYAHSLSNQIRVMRERPVQPPPMPGQTNWTVVTEPLPYGTNRSYESHILELRARMAQEKRRSQ